MKQHYGWRQEGTAERYSEETRNRAMKMARLLVGDKEGRENFFDKNSSGNRKENGTEKDKPKTYHIDWRGASNCNISFNW